MDLLYFVILAATRPFPPPKKDTKPAKYFFILTFKNQGKYEEKEREKKRRKKKGGSQALSSLRQGILPPACPVFDRLFRFGLGAAWSSRPAWPPGRLIRASVGPGSWQATVSYSCALASDYVRRSEVTTSWRTYQTARRYHCGIQ